MRSPEVSNRETSSGSSGHVDYLVPIDPMDELHCESCQ